MSRKKTTSEKAKFKQEIHRALYKNADLRNYIVDDIGSKSPTEIRSAFKAHVKSHLFVEDTIKDVGTYIFYDVIFPSLRSNVKSCSVIMYAICHREIIEVNDSEKYFGDRIDAVSQIIEECLINDTETVNKFGIGELSIDGIGIYNSNRFYGAEIRLSVPNFR